ncbi:Cytochrome P450 9e2 [Habropoda laboriosa]|uniref:Cytochrome P450 9e2 n=1 Tax=Habropoda laboriosa TaxID=597456 RepID=A0A0L7QR58_9HYME|nr:PREDICTED: cytochrome P450 9e2-like [Habropoda laboriosa]KOC61112.1 Cytochrome P450 9e2 [Habropoda laboriosa]
MEWWSVSAALIAVIIVLYYKFTTDYGFFERRGIPYSRPIPILGSIWKAMLLQVTFAEATKEIYNINAEAKYVGFFDFATPVIGLRDLDLIKSITVKNFEHFPNHRSFQDMKTDPLFSKNLFALRGDRWKEVRTLLSPAFTSSKMKAMFVLMRDCAKLYGDYLASIPPDQRIIELKEAFTRYTNDVIGTCAFGIEVNSMKEPKNKFYVYGREATNFSRSQSLKFFLIRTIPKLSRMLGVKVVRDEIAEFFKDLVGTTIKTRDEQGIVRPDMIQLMMETRGKLGPGKELSIEDMTAQAFIFFFGGFESTSTLMCFAAYEVGVNEEIQKRLQEEIDQVLEDCKGEVTYEAINDMKYLDAIINEALRMYPVIVAVDRACVKAFELPPALPGGKPHVVQPGEFLWLPIYGIQNDPNHFPEPNKFNPDRFYDDPKKVNSGAFLVFGMGPRMCIGNRFAILEAKVLLFHIFARCTFKTCSKTVIPMKLSKKGFAMTAENGFWFDVQPRSNTQPLLDNSVCSNGVAA